MQLLTSGDVNIKPAHYNMTIRGFDRDNGRLYLDLSATLDVMTQLTSIMPLLTPEGRRVFPRVTFWIDTPVKLSYLRNFDAVELTGQRTVFKVVEQEIRCFVPGYEKAIIITVDTLVDAIDQLCQTLGAGEFTNIVGGVTRVPKQRNDVFGVTGVRIKQVHSLYVIATHNNDMCVISSYTHNPDQYLYQRLDDQRPIMYFTYTDENGWEMTPTPSKDLRAFYNATQHFNWF